MKHSAILYPSHWPRDVAEGAKIPVSNKDLQKLKLNFQTSLNASFKIVSIEEICHREIFNRYERFE